MNWLKRRKKLPARQQRQRPSQHEKKRHGQWPIIQALSRIADQIKSASEEEEKEDRASAQREIITIGLVFVTFITAGIGDCIFYGTMQDGERSNVEANRAWVGASYISQPATSPGVVAGNPLTIYVNFQNTGHDPALNFNVTYNFEVIPETDPQFSAPVYGGVNLACDSILRTVGGAVIFPGPNVTHQGTTIIPAEYVTNTVASGQSILVMQGCFLYDTMGQEAATDFCFVAVRDGKVDAFDNTQLCQDGNDAE